MHMINERLTADRIIASKVKGENNFTTLVINTWEQALKKEGDIPPNRIIDQP